MSKIIIVLTCTLLLAGCRQLVKKDAPHTEEPSADTMAAGPQTKITSSKEIQNANDLIGSWVGWFEPDREVPPEKMIYAGESTAYDYNNKILFSIDSLDGTKVFGHSVVAGNDRPFYGEVKQEGNSYVFHLKEPGDDKYDGQFTASVDVNDTILNGTWEAYKKIETPKRKYALTKKIFVYNPKNQLDRTFIDWYKIKKRKSNPDEEDYYDKEYFATTNKVYSLNPSVQKLTKSDVENLTKADLFVLRNSIYAKHGYSFKSRQLRTFFDHHDWYIPVHIDIKKDLTPLEKDNIKLLMKYEKNAAEYYDEFGRG